MELNFTLGSLYCPNHVLCVTFWWCNKVTYLLEEKNIMRIPPTLKGAHKRSQIEMHT